MLKIEDFLEKYNKELLKFNDKVDIFHSNFKENNKFKIVDVDYVGVCSSRHLLFFI